MDNLRALTKKMQEETHTTYGNLPDLDLYMDQVLAYLSRQHISFREEDKLTSAMVNNYKKSGLLPRTNGKKYSRKHLVYLTLISRLKQVLSVKDTDTLLKEDMKDCLPKDYYESFLGMLDSSLGNLHQSLDMVEEDNLSHTALQFALTAYTNKIACEYLIDKINLQNQPIEKEEKKAKAAKDKEKEKLTSQ